MRRRVYGVMHYSVTQRIPEIGVRMAFGAGGKDIVALFMRRAMRFAGAGLAVGLVLALWSASLIKGMLFGVTNTDPLSFLWGPIVAHPGSAIRNLPSRPPRDEGRPDGSAEIRVMATIMLGIFWMRSQEV